MVGFLPNKSSDKRPVFLNLLQISLPMTALVSILHRASGVGLILSMPVLVLLQWLLLSTVQPSVEMRFWLSLWWIQVILFLVLTGSMYHLLAGVRHLYHDISLQHSLQSSRVSAYSVISIWILWVLYCLYRFL